MKDETLAGEGTGTEAEAPKKLQRTLKKLAAEGEEPVIIAPALLQRHASEQMLAMARMGMMDKIFSYIITTKKNVHFIRPGLMWDSVQSVPLEKIDDVEYVNEFHSNTLKLLIGTAEEKLIFYDDTDGIKFYRYIKYKQWKS
ncbi:MAG TPA: hypothetical protein VLB04_11565 [Methanotrichaceae archaeon]|nr:hypothetical protein [Methanotrichaceae archaeon]